MPQIEYMLTLTGVNYKQALIHSQFGVHASERSKTEYHTNVEMLMRAHIINYSYSYVRRITILSFNSIDWQSWYCSLLSHYFSSYLISMLFPILFLYYLEYMSTFRKQLAIHLIFFCLKMFSNFILGANPKNFILIKYLRTHEVLNEYSMGKTMIQMT